MYLAKKDGNLYFIREIRLCCYCCRMFCLNDQPHIIGWCNGNKLYQHLHCPTERTEYERRPKLKGIAGQEESPS